VCELKVKNNQNHFFLPVVHCLNVEQTMNQLKLVFNNKADGVFLIGHGIRYNELFDIYYHVRDAYLDNWIGLNCLDLAPLELFLRIPEGVNGVWVDKNGKDCILVGLPLNIKKKYTMLLWLLK
jgi:hypothetical protein